MQWYYYSRGQQTGPLSDEEFFQAVRAGRVRADDHVWNATMGAQWVEARQVPGLFTPPPLTATPSATAGSSGAEAWDPKSPLRISCFESANRAWQRTKEILFRPFDLGKWFALGFSAWLATLGDQGGGSFTPGGGEWIETAAAEMKQDPAVALVHLYERFLDHATVIIVIVSTIVALTIVVGAVMLWLRCRGRFMFLDNVVHNRMAVTYPWRTFRQHGNSLFVWSLVFALVGLAVFAILVAVAAVSIVNPIIRAHALTGLAPVVAANAVVWLVVAVVFGYIRLFLVSFVVPIMYNENKTATEAWGRFLALFGEHGFAFVGYGFFYLLWTLLIGMCVVVAILGTCCLGLCILVLPYVGAVAMLPATVFMRCLGLEYLAQFGPEFRMRAEG